MSFVERLVLDTSTVVSAMLRPQSLPRQAFLHAFARYEVCVSSATLAEFEKVLMRPKFDRYLEQKERLAFYELYRTHARLRPLTEIEERALGKVCRDKNDQKFLALALSCGANTLISSDADLLILQPWRSISILSPSDFLASF